MIISDNTSQFKLGNSVIDEVWGNVITNLEIQSYIDNVGIEWKYITEYAPQMGGFYE